MSAPIKVKCLRPMFFHGERVEAGAVLALDPIAAGAAIASGRAVLADSADAGHVQEAVTEQSERLLGSLNVIERQSAAVWALRRRA
jgi:hypothetical protein